MKLFHNFLYALLAAACLAGCTDEQERGTQPAPDPGDTSAARREVRLTLDNKLALPTEPTRADETIATQAENTVSALDVYAFGSTTETGTYTYLERFAYRAEGNIPAGASPMELTVGGEKGEKLSTVLNLRKGFFVRLYCLANQTELVNPLTNAPVLPTDYIGINYTLSDLNDVTVLADGEPTEEQFKSFHSVLIDPADADAVITTPLPMAGGQIVPLDLRSATATSLMSAGFRMERPLARFDVRNNAETSRLLIDTVTLSHGRKATTFFPVEVYGTRPEAAAGDLITYPGRVFEEDADINTGYQAGAFYSYPALQSDAASLIIKGRYQVNQTEQKAVTYEVPFRQEDESGEGIWLEIQPNHRYTVNITNADEYELRFNLSVADWTDQGNIDDYEPDNTPGAFSVVVPDEFAAAVSYDEATHTVTMGLEANINFSVVTKTNAALSVTVSYQGNVTGQEWLFVDDPLIEAAISDDYKYSSKYTYPVTLTPDYAGGRYPRATLRFTNMATGDEQILFVKLNGVPTISDAGTAALPGDAPESSKLNEYDVQKKEANLLRIQDSQLLLTVVCAGGINIEIPEAQKSVFSVEKLSQNDDEYTLLVKLLDTTYAGSDLSFTIRNAETNNLAEEVALILVNADVQATVEATAEASDVTVTPATQTEKEKVTVPLVAENVDADATTGKAPAVFKVEASAVKEIKTVTITFDNDSKWLDYEIQSAAPVTRAIVPDTGQINFFVVKDQLSGAKPATVKVVNSVSEAKSYEFVVVPEVKEATITLVETTLPAADFVDNTAKKLMLYKLPEDAPDPGSIATAEIVYLGGVESVVCSDNTLLTVTKQTIAGNKDPNKETYKLTPLKEGTCNLTITSKVPDAATGVKPTVVYAVTVRSSSLNLAAKSDSLSLNMAANTTASFTVTQAWKGCTIEMPTWGGATGQQWFTLSSTSLDSIASGSTTAVTVTLKGEDELTTPTKDNVKQVKLTLKNPITNGGDTSVVITPKWVVPALLQGQESSRTLSEGAKDTIKVSIPLGGIAAKAKSESVVTVSVTNTNEVVIETVANVADGASDTVFIYNNQLTYANLSAADKLAIPVSMGGGETVTIGNLIWAAGNLVANGANSCKIGKPTDKGLYFRWGSLVGYDDSAGNPTPVVKPAEYFTSPTFTGSPSATAGQAIPDPAQPSNGIGDPCKYYLKGKWRMPTSQEYLTLGGGVSTGTTFTTYLYTTIDGVSGIRIPKTGDTYVFFPLTGNRNNSSGAVQTQTFGYVWSSTPNGSNTWFLYFNSGNALVYNNNPTYGFSVRCVQEK